MRPRGPADPAYVVADLHAETLLLADRAARVALAAHVLQDQGRQAAHPHPPAVGRVAPTPLGAVERHQTARPQAKVVAVPPAPPPLLAATARVRVEAGPVAACVAPVAIGHLAATEKGVTAPALPVAEVGAQQAQATVPLVAAVASATTRGAFRVRGPPVMARARLGRQDAGVVEAITVVVGHRLLVATPLGETSLKEEGAPLDPPVRGVAPTVVAARQAVVEAGQATTRAVLPVPVRARTRGQIPIPFGTTRPPLPPVGVASRVVATPRVDEVRPQQQEVLTAGPVEAVLKTHRILKRASAAKSRTLLVCPAPVRTEGAWQNRHTGHKEVAKVREVQTVVPDPLPHDLARPAPPP